MTSKMRNPNIGSIRITDPLFGRYVRLVAEHIIPYQWEILNDRVEGAKKSCCIENFRIAAGEKQGVHQGVVFCDTDAYKWLEAVSYCLAAGAAREFEQTADALIDLIGRAQQPDGYLNTYYTIAHPEERWQNLCEGHELYSGGHMIEAAVAYYYATGKAPFLNIAKRFADLICRVFGPGEAQCKGYPGHQEIELALVKLYRATGEERYLALARYFIEERGKAPNYLLQERSACGEHGIFSEFASYDEVYAQTYAPPAEQKSAEGHAVRAMYMYCAMADIAQECGDEALKNACIRLWESVTKRRMYITGGIGSSGFWERFTTDYDLPNDSSYCESCASVGLMMFGSRMAMLMRDASYYDTVERALCNNVLAGVAVSGDRYFYVNPLEVWPDNCLENTSLAHIKSVRQGWFPVACCPTNLARTFASLGRYIYAEDDKSIYIHQFISSALQTRIQETDVSVELRQSYMQDGCVRITVSAAEAKAFTLRVRIPAYAENPSFALDGKRIAPVVENGYAVLAVSRSGKQEFALHFDAPPRFVTANQQVRADLGKVAVCKGPFVYCLEQADNGENLASVRVSPQAAVHERAPLSGLPGALPTLCYTGRRITKTVSDPDALYGAPAFAQAPAELTAIPYFLWCNRMPGEMLVWQKADI